MKKLLFIFLIAIIFNNNHTLASETNNDLLMFNIISNYSFEKDFVTREEAIRALMKILGVTPKMSKLSTDVKYFGPLFNDFAYFRPSDGYVSIAGHERIALGSYGKFYPSRNITLKETIAFIMRCLESNDDSQNIDVTFNRAREIKLILNTDNFYTESGDENLTKDDFCLLLNRFLKQKRYVYFDPNESQPMNYFGLVRDENKSITYYEFLEEKLKLNERTIIGVWHDILSVGAGEVLSNHYHFYDYGFFKFDYDEGSYDKEIIRESGTWKIVENELFLTIEKKFIFNTISKKEETIMFDSPEEKQISLSEMKQDPESIHSFYMMNFSDVKYWKINNDPKSYE